MQVSVETRTSPEAKSSATSAPSVLPQTNLPVATTAPPAGPALKENATNAPAQPPKPRLPPDVFPRPPASTLELQVALARAHCSPGSIDGNIGPQTRAALCALQGRLGLPRTGELDAATESRVLLERPPLQRYTITADDIGRLQPLSDSWLGKSRQSALAYESLPELLGERSRASPTLIRRINPAVRWAEVSPGTTVQMPDVPASDPERKAAFVRIRLGDRSLQAFDGNELLLAHFPCSIARKVDKRPVGQLRVEVLVPDPNYTFDPDVFPESEEGRRLGRRLILPPGPNNPVGVAWIGLDRPGYGIHGTPQPEQVGRTESHGCFRLANWNAALLLRMAWVGMPVMIEP